MEIVPQPSPSPQGTGPTSDFANSHSTEERLVKLVREKLQTLGSNSVTLHTLSPGESFSRMAQALDPTFNDSALLVLEGCLVGNNNDATHVFPRGYLVTRPQLLAEQWDLSGDSQPTTLIQIPRAQLREWFLNDDSFYQLALTRIHEVFPKERMPEVSREQIRTARDQSLLAITTRQAIDFVNRKGGLFEQLNPEAIPINHHDTIGGRDRTIGPTEQIWQVVEAVSPVMIHLDNAVIEHYAERARRTSVHLRSARDSDNVEIALKWFQIELAAEKVRIFEENMQSLAAYIKDDGFLPSTDAGSIIADRVLQIHSLYEAVVAAREQRPQTTESRTNHYLNADWDATLCRCYETARDGNGGGMHALLEKLDDTLEVILTEARTIGNEELVNVAIEKFQLALDIEPLETEELPADHHTRQQLTDLHNALANGDRSAVGGSAYPRQRFPRITLNQLVHEQKPALVFDGTYEKGMHDLRRTYGRHPVDPSLLMMGTVVNLEGVYGSFDKSWCFFRNGQSALLISHSGEGRQISNAAALLLFETHKGERIPVSNLRLARDKVPVTERIQQAVDGLLAAENYARRGTIVLGEKILDPRSIPTQTHTFQHPEMLLKTIQEQKANSENLYVIPVDDPELQKLYIVYWKQSSGELCRLLLPTVGSRGLYGDTAGAFTQAVMNTSQLTTVSRHTIFHATAGGFAGTASHPSFGAPAPGLPEDISHGALIMPWLSVTDSRGEYSFNNMLRIAEASDNVEVQGLLAKIHRQLDQLELYHTGKHYCIEAPALETEGLIEHMVASGHASVDVESAPVVRAGPDSFTAVYVYSDDPRQGLKDLTKSLAFGAPLAEGSRPVPGLYKAFIDMMQLAALLDKRHV